jgi:hypothetical protein
MSSFLQRFRDKLENKTARYQGEDGIILFCKEVLRVEIAPYQENILRCLVRYKRVAVRGPHGLGKTAVASWAVLWAVTCHEGDVKVPTTASSWQQLTKYLWPEIRKWASKADWSILNIRMRRHKELLDQSIKLENKEAFAIGSANPERMEGAHGSTLFYVFDEAKAIPKDTWNAVEGAFSTAGQDTDDTAYALAISTPGETSGVFYEIHSRKDGYEDWHVIHVTLAEALKAGRISMSWVEKCKRLWGEASGIFKKRVLGEFDDSDEEVVIPLSWVEAANERWKAVNGIGNGIVSYGVDVARFGQDKTTIVKKIGDVVGTITYKSKQDTMKTVGNVVNIVEYKDDKIGVDVIGIGAGVVDRLKELGYAVIGVNVGAKANAKDEAGLTGFRNLRSQLWWMVREMLDPSNNPTLALPPDDKLTGDLTTPKYTYMSNGDIVVESKDDIRTRIGRSTDSADVVMLACYAPIAPQPTGKKWEQMEEFDKMRY